MNETGIIRTLDNMGRIVIPSEIRKMLDMTDGVDKFEIFMQGDEIVLKKYQPSCFFCGSDENTVDFDNRKVCVSCIEKLQMLKEENQDK
ncbi:MAG: AbrB/MazE/SpoVT family DNA-binding domain-containing protein [Acutalibacteraceae bacterium]|nr:AbrB/MazE/SpoVT family DNA-binding domain-containing protein [Acutalibacteraceae bacterium]